MADRKPFTVESAAKYLGCSPAHVRNLCARGELGHFRLGRLIRIQYLGHSSETVTYRVYARFSPDYLRRAASALE